MVYDLPAKTYPAFAAAVKSAEANRDAAESSQLQHQQDIFTITEARKRIEGLYGGGGNFQDMVGATNALMEMNVNVSWVNFVIV